MQSTYSTAPVDSAVIPFKSLLSEIDILIDHELRSIDKNILTLIDR